MVRGCTSAFELVKAALRKRIMESREKPWLPPLPPPPPLVTPRVGSSMSMRCRRPSTGRHADCVFNGLRHGFNLLSGQ